MEIKPNSVGAVVVTYNRLELLKQVLDSLLAQTRPVDHIYVVDNASSDGTAEFLAGLGNPKVSSTRMPTNTGGAGGFSYGMKWVFDEGHEWIWMMDDDVAPLCACLEHLLRFAKHYRVLLTLPLTRESGLWRSAAMKLNLTQPFTKKFRIGHVNEVYPRLEDTPEIVPVEDLTFEGPMFHRSVPEKIGYPDGRLFIYLDDADYGIRISKGGLGPMVLVRDARLVKQITSLESPSPVGWQQYYYWRNLLYVQRTYAGNRIMKCWPYCFFIMLTLKRCFRKNLTLRELTLRYRAICDSIRETLPRRYLPS